MKANSFVRMVVLAAVASGVWLADVPDRGRPRVGLVPEAAAVVGAPMTPFSVAGVARRTTRRVVVAESAAAQSTAQQQQAVAQQQAATAQQQAATAQQQAAVARQQSGAPPVGSMVSSLPAGCVQEVRDGVAYQQCGGVYYRPAFQGNNLVYVVQ
jgi:hypothetical protein